MEPNSPTTAPEVTPQPVPTSTPANVTTQPQRKLFSKKNLFLIGTGALLVLIVLGLVIYRFVYIPSMAARFVNDTQPAYSDIKSRNNSLFSNVQNLFAAGEDKTTTGSRTDVLKDAQQLGESLKAEGEKVKATLPQGNPAADEKILSDLRAYYDLSIEIGGSYAEFNATLGKVLSVLEQSIATVGTTSAIGTSSPDQYKKFADEYRKKAQDFAAQKTQLPAVDAEKNPELASFVQKYGEFLDALVAYFNGGADVLNELANAGLVGGQSKLLTAQTKFQQLSTDFNEAVSAMSKSGETADSAIVKLYSDRSRTSKELSDKIDAEFTAYKQGYGVN